MGGFAVYRLPYAKQATLIRQTEGEPLELSSCQALNGQQGFVIAPFEITPAQPIVLIRPDETEVVACSVRTSSCAARIYIMRDLTVTDATLNRVRTCS